MNNNETRHPYYEMTVIIAHNCKSMTSVLLGYEETIMSSVNDDMYNLILGAKSPVEFWQHAHLAKIAVYVFYSPSFKNTDADSLPDYLNELQFADKILKMLQS